MLGDALTQAGGHHASKILNDDSGKWELPDTKYPASNLLNIKSVAASVNIEPHDVNIGGMLPRQWC